MQNEYGAPLDKNGYAPSIVQFDLCACWRCGSMQEKLDRHEAFGGAYRQKSKRLGLWVMLCHNECHIFGDYAAHNCAMTAHKIKQAAQKAAMQQYGWSTEDFIREFGKNYL